MDWKNSLKIISKEIDNGYFSFKSLKELLEDYNTKLEAVYEKLRTTEKARAFFQVQAENTQREVSETLSVIITSALKSVFPDDYECVIEFTGSGAKLYLKKGEDSIEDPINSVGGGVIDIASFAARVAFIFLSGSSRVLIADEPFKAVSSDLRVKIPEMLQLLSEKLGVQFIIVSHLQEIIEGADNVVFIKGGSVL